MRDSTLDLNGNTPDSIDEGQFAASLLTIGGVADRAMVARTLRRVREREMEIAERRYRARKAIGVAILGLSLLLLVLTPVTWSAVHMELQDGWQDFSGVDMQSMYVLGWIFPVTVAGLVLAGIGVRARRGARRIDHQVGTRLSSLMR